MSSQRKGPKEIAMRFVRFLVGLTFGVIIPAAILGAGIYGAKYLMDTAPQAERDASANRDEVAQLIDAVQLESGDQRVIVETMGLVVPARTVELQPRVEGEVISVHPNLEEGGTIAQGEVIAQIDPADYELEVMRSKAMVAQMQSALELEMGQQEVAREEFELLGENIPEGQRGLVLRKPQLDSAKADLDSVKASLRAAELDLERTTMKAPLNGLVLEENADKGSIASTNETLAELVGTDLFWVELSVPVDNLRWIEMPGADGRGGSLVHIYDSAAWGGGIYREGRVVRFTASVDEQSRMARLLVGVVDPLALEPENAGQPTLLLGSYVKGMIYGSNIPDAVALPREHLRENNTVWVMNNEGRLDIREVEILWRGKNEVFVTAGLDHGDWIVTTNLSAPVNGMKLRMKEKVAPTEEMPGNKGEELAAQTPQVNES